jgi:carbamoyltransferase
MLVTTTVKEEWRSKLPAITHIDNSARHQSVTEKNNPKFYKLISSFYNKTGIPVLLNTSFNGPHEPIVETPKEAIRTFLDRGIDFLVINNFIISRSRFGE